MGRFYPGLTTIGITGTIGSGKSTVGRILDDLAIPVIDSDQIVHKLLASDQETKRLVVERFGSSVLLHPIGGEAAEIDRQALARIIFQDTDCKADLEGILHPRVREASQKLIEQYARNPSIKLVASLVPLLFEANLGNLYDQTWAVIADDSILRERLKARDHFSEVDLERRLASQWPQEKKASLADKIIDNSRDLAFTRSQVIDLVNQIAN